MLKTCHTITDLQQILFPEKARGLTIGFVPTMGALHAGHLSLIKASRQSTDITVCSIFVNPTQFNDPEDFKKYPQNLERDLEMLEAAGCHYVFAPSVHEMYPDDSYRKITFVPGDIAGRYEGASRPGHFAGMTAVVKRLFDIVQPDKAFFGQKDYQQYLIVGQMIGFYALPIDLVRCPIIREANGLAMSSRNERLSPGIRERASVIYQTLQWAREMIVNKSLPFSEIKREATAAINSDGNFTADYFDICSAKTLEPAENAAAGSELVAVTAVYTEGVRLIDNLLV